MPYTIPPELIIEKNKLDSSGLFLELFEFTLSEAGSTLRLVNNNEDVVWNSLTWSRSQFQPGDFTESIDGGIESIDIRVSNLLEHGGKTIQRHIEDATIDNALGDLVNYYLVNSENLDKGAAISINFEIQNISCSEQFCNFTLGMENFYYRRFPLNVFRRNICRWKVFGGPECRFALSSANDCDRRFVTCIGFGNQLRFGGFPGIPRCGTLGNNKVGAGTPWIGGGGASGGGGSGGFNAVDDDEVVTTFVAISITGTGNRVMTSINGIDWLIQSSASDDSWRDIAYSPTLGLYAAVGGTGVIMTSPDGISWTNRTSPTSTIWQGITWAPPGLWSATGLFVAVGPAGRIMSSSNGTTWTSRTSPTANDWNSVAWSASQTLFVCVGQSGTSDRVITSPNGVTWTTRTSSDDNSWNDVAYSPTLDLYVAVASSGSFIRVMTSPDGFTWTTRATAGDLNRGWNSIAWSPSLAIFAAVASNGTGNRVMTSTNGIDWTTRTSASDDSWQSVVWSATLALFVAVATGGANIMTSSDGITWTNRTAPNSNQWFGVTVNQ